MENIIPILFPGWKNTISVPSSPYKYEWFIATIESFIV
jgi:hypothetical protein